MKKLLLLISICFTSLFSEAQLSSIVNLQNPVYCFGQCNGAVIVSATGGSAPYTYTLLPSAMTGTFTSNTVLSNLCAGQFTVIVADQTLATNTNTYSLIQPTPLFLNLNTTNVSCSANCDGSIFGFVNGGTAPYAYNWSPSAQTTPFLQGLCPGSYTLDVVDANGCFVSQTATIFNTGNGPLTGVSTTLTPYQETCLYSGDGAIDLTISGSNPGPFTYQWNTGATTQDVTNIITNTYSVTIFDAAMNCMTYTSAITANGTNCGSVNGNVFIDNNSDCVKNTGDNNLINGFVIANPGNHYGYTNNNGDYFINNLPYGTYSLSIGNTYSGLIPSCTTTINATINSGQPNSYNNNLSAGFNSNTQPDIKVSSWSGGIVPGFSNYMNYTLSNQNNVNGSGILKVTLPSAFIPNITLVTPSTYTLSGDTIMWTFTNLNYTNNPYASFVIQFTTPISTPLGSVFSSCAYAQTTMTDFNPLNNTYCYYRTVTGSFDPNDKTPNPVGVGATGDIAASVTDLTYLIRFQNTGNGPAVNIVVKDTLSPNVDVNTLEMLGSSHNYNIEILPGNILKWKFNNIMLPDSNSNEPGSHGYIQYRIKRNNNNTPGTQIKNTAYIYFDFNEPVVTNTAINTIETITGISSQTNSNDGWNVYPNPSTGALYIVNSSLSKETSQVQVLNAIGQTVLEETITSNYKNIDLSKLNNGVYFVKISSENNSIVKRVVLRK